MQHIRKIVVFLANEFVYNGHLQSISASSVVYFSYIFIFQQSVNYDILFVIYLLFESIFLFDRFRDIEVDKSTNMERSRHISRYRKKANIILTGFLFLLFSILIIKNNFWFTIYIAGVIILGFLYPVYFKKVTSKIYFFKNFYVSSVYATLAFVPAIFAGDFNEHSVFVFSLYVFYEVFFSQMCLDFKDISIDKMHSLKTLPVVFGKENALFLLFLLVFLSPVFIYFADNSIEMTGLVVSMIVTNLTILIMVKRGVLYGYFLAAGKFILWYLVVLALNI